jgi:hypothetical protein
LRIRAAFIVLLESGGGADLGCDLLVEVKFANRKIAPERIWKAIQSLREVPANASPVAAAEQMTAVEPEPTPEVATEAPSEVITEEATAAAEVERALRGGAYLRGVSLSTQWR